jgi:hypothetical protein
MLQMDLQLLSPRLSWTEVQRFPQEELAIGTMKREKWDSRDTIFARTDAGVDSLLYMVSIAGGRVL